MLAMLVGPQNPAKVMLVSEDIITDLTAINSVLVAAFDSSFVKQDRILSPVFVTNFEKIYTAIYMERRR